MIQTYNNVKIFSLDQEIWHGLTITNSAAYQIKFLKKNNPDMLGLRLSIKKSGCAGFGYVIEKVTQFIYNDKIYEHSGAKLCVPLKFMPFLDGTEIDYVKKGLSYMFKFNNPKAQHSCGCGDSFSL